LIRGPLIPDVGDLECPFRRKGTSEQGIGVGADYRIEPPLLGVSQQCAVQGDGAKRITLGPKENAKLGPAQPGRIR